MPNTKYHVKIFTLNRQREPEAKIFEQKEISKEEMKRLLFTYKGMKVEMVIRSENV